MKITCISTSRVPSDTANSIQVMKVCQAFVQLGYEVTLIVPGEKPEGCALQAQYGLTRIFPVEWLPVPTRRLFPFRAVIRANALGTDLLYCWPVQAGFLGLLAGLPVMVELHDLPGGRFGPTWFKLLLSTPGRKRLLPITSALSRALSLPAEITLVAPDGVDLERYEGLPDPAEARRLLGFPQKPTVLCTGHLYAGRGVELFLRLAEHFPQAGFAWVGGKPAEVEKWKSHAARLGNVRFTGFVPNERIPLHQAAGDVLLMPYERTIATSSGGNTAEVCSPMKMFEYMAAGRAILSSNLPVLREVLDEETAVFCPPEDEQAWMEALNELLGDAGKRRVLGQRARQAVEKYSWMERCRRVLEGFA